jgi:hypothetical protein
MQNPVCKAILSESLIATNGVKMTFGPVRRLFLRGSMTAERRSENRS